MAGSYHKRQQNLRARRRPRHGATFSGTIHAGFCSQWPRMQVSTGRRRTARSSRARTLGSAAGANVGQGGVRGRLSP